MELTLPVCSGRGSRLGIYFLEAGANQRPSVVVYDRAYSSIYEAKAEDYNFKEMFKGGRNGFIYQE